MVLWTQKKTRNPNLNPKKFDFKLDLQARVLMPERVGGLKVGGCGRGFWGGGGGVMTSNRRCTLLERKDLLCVWEGTGRRRDS
jgi:hypothetical protein